MEAVALDLKKIKVNSPPPDELTGARPETASLDFRTGRKRKLATGVTSSPLKTTPGYCNMLMTEFICHRVPTVMENPGKKWSWKSHGKYKKSRMSWKFVCQEKMSWKCHGNQLSKSA